MKIDKRTEERFVENIDFDFQTECWVWIGTLSYGYGVFWMDGQRRQLTAHRIAYELWIGEIVDENTIDHLCANRRCVNPLHLEQCSRVENSYRARHRGLSGQNARKTHCKRGHEFTEENTYINATSGNRQCRACHRAYSNEKNRRQREKEAIHRKAGATA